MQARLLATGRIAAATLLILVAGCETLPERPPKVKDGVAYGVVDGLFQHRFWHYYARGLSFADGGFWDDAEADLREAIRQRDEDQRMARSYGMHFMDYFPHGELGVVLFQKARSSGSPALMAEAVSELERSVAQVKYAKAEYYLDLARKASIQTGSGTPGKPEITIAAPAEGTVTNAFSITVSGMARDAGAFVRRIRVGGKPVRVDVSEKAVPFAQAVALSSGENRITVVAVNLAGAAESRTIRVQVDRAGPVISGDGDLFDDFGLASVTAGGRTIPVSGRQVRLQDIGLALPGSGADIAVADIAGNVTHARIGPAGMPASRAEPPLLAGGDNPWDEMTDAGPWIALGEAPASLNLTLNQPAERSTYIDRAVIDGTIRAGEPSTRLTIRDGQGETVLYVEPPRENYHFSCLAGLKEGDNFFSVRAETPSRKTDEMTVRIHRHIPVIHQTEARMKMALSPFQRTLVGPADATLNTGFESRLREALLDNEPERFADVMEMPPESEGKTGPRKGIQTAAKDMGAHAILFGRVEGRVNSQGKNSLIIRARLEDVEGTRIIKEGETEVFGEDVDLDNVSDRLDALAQFMAVKLVDELPLVEGRVVEKTGSQLGLDIGQREKMKRGLDLIVYEAAAEDADPLILGEAKIIQTAETQSKARLYREEKEVKTQNAVITR